MNENERPKKVEVSFPLSVSGEVESIGPRIPVREEILHLGFAKINEQKKNVTKILDIFKENVTSDGIEVILINAEKLAAKVVKQKMEGMNIFPFPIRGVLAAALIVTAKNEVTTRYGRRLCS